ncbi:MAG: PadR family transcriptional regulator [bacterium]|nr:PadR family transcriptional regulator [bacterium]
MKYTLGEFEEIVLLLVAAQNNEAYGLSITNAIIEKLNRKVTMSSVHTALYRLEEKGFVQSSIGGATAERGGRRKRFFSITATGKSALKESREARNQLWDLIPELVIGKL